MISLIVPFSSCKRFVLSYFHIFSRKYCKFHKYYKKLF